EGRRDDSERRHLSGARWLGQRRCPAAGQGQRPARPGPGVSDRRADAGLADDRSIRTTAWAVLYRRGRAVAPGNWSVGLPAVPHFYGQLAQRTRRISAEQFVGSRVRGDPRDEQRWSACGLAAPG